MHEDKLEHDERLRLECLAQAIQSNLGRPKSTVDTVKRAAAFEAFVRKIGRASCRERV